MYILCLRGEKELNMALSLRRTLLLVGLVLVLIAALLTWSLTVARSAAPSQHASYRSSHLLAWYCPPPPRYC
jgi:hypothetical protein